MEASTLRQPELQPPIAAWDDFFLPEPSFFESNRNLRILGIASLAFAALAAIATVAVALVFTATPIVVVSTFSGLALLTIALAAAGIYMLCKSFSQDDPETHRERARAAGKEIEEKNMGYEAIRENFGGLIDTKHINLEAIRRGLELDVQTLTFDAFKAKHGRRNGIKPAYDFISGENKLILREKYLTSLQERINPDYNLSSFARTILLSTEGKMFSIRQEELDQMIADIFCAQAEKRVSLFLEEIAKQASSDLGGCIALLARYPLERQFFESAIISQATQMIFKGEQKRFMEDGLDYAALRKRNGLQCIQKSLQGENQEKYLAKLKASFLSQPYETLMSAAYAIDRQMLNISEEEAQEEYIEQMNKIADGMSYLGSRGFRAKYGKDLLEKRHLSAANAERFREEITAHLLKSPLEQWEELRDEIECLTLPKEDILRKLMAIHAEKLLKAGIYGPLQKDIMAILRDCDLVFGSKGNPLKSAREEVSAEKKRCDEKQQEIEAAHKVAVVEAKIGFDEMIFQAANAPELLAHRSNMANAQRAKTESASELERCTQIVRIKQTELQGAEQLIRRLTKQQAEQNEELRRCKSLGERLPQIKITYRQQKQRVENLRERQTREIQSASEEIRRQMAALERQQTRVIAVNEQLNRGHVETIREGQEVQRAYEMQSRGLSDLRSRLAAIQGRVDIRRFEALNAKFKGVQPEREPQVTGLGGVISHAREQREREEWQNLSREFASMQDLERQIKEIEPVVEERRRAFEIRQEPSRSASSAIHQQNGEARALEQQLTHLRSSLQRTEHDIVARYNLTEEQILLERLKREVESAESSIAKLSEISGTLSSLAVKISDAELSARRISEETVRAEAEKITAQRRHSEAEKAFEHASRELNIHERTFASEKEQAEKLLRSKIDLATTDRDLQLAGEATLQQRNLSAIEDRFREAILAA